MQASKYLEVRICASCMDDEAFEQWCEALHATATASEIDADSGEETRLAWFDVDTHASAQLLDSLQRAGIDESACQLHELEETDWTTAWQKDWQAMAIGDSLWVRPSFCEPAPAGKIDIVLDPGMAFGTGTHPTTRLCLQAIEHICRARPISSLLDMGAGSGILAIAALKLGVGSALAIDMAEESVAACRTNADINGVTLDVQWTDTPPAAMFELVIANILAGPLIDMAPALAACTKRMLVLSGLLTEQMESVQQAYEAQGLILHERHTEGEWAALIMQRP